MRRISQFRDLFEADPGEKIIVTVESKNVPHSVTFSAGPVFTNEELPPPRERKSFVMDATNPSFTIAYFFPPVAVPDPQPHYLVSFNGKNGTSDGPARIDPLSSNSVTQLYEFRVPAAPAATPAVAKKAGPPKAKTAAPPATTSIEDLAPAPAPPPAAAKAKPKTKAKKKSSSPAKPPKKKKKPQ